jgi:hypothetical protein
MDLTPRLLGLLSLLLLCFSAFLHFFTGLFQALSCLFHGSTRLFFGLLH